MFSNIIIWILKGGLETNTNVCNIQPSIFKSSGAYASWLQAKGRLTSATDSNNTCKRLKIYTQKFNKFKRKMTAMIKEAMWSLKAVFFFLKTETNIIFQPGLA